MQSGDEVRVLEGKFSGKDGVILLPLSMGAEVIIDRQRVWLHRAEFEQVVTV